MEDIRRPRHVIDRLEHRWVGRLQQEQRQKQPPPIRVRCKRTVRGPSRSSLNALAEQTPGLSAHEREGENREAGGLPVEIRPL